MLTQSLIDGEQLKAELEQAVKYCKNKILFISAYITQNAIDWLESIVPKSVEVHLICRLAPTDIINSSTSISALINALDNSWKVSCLHSLHAKIYSIDEQQIYIGSANLTSNGLRIYGIGNIEACSCVPPNQENLRFIAKIKELSNKLNHELLRKMERYIENKDQLVSFDMWPEGILLRDEGVWVRDFFWLNPLSSIYQNNEQIHDLEVIGAKNIKLNNKEISKKILMSRCVQWLISKLKEQPTFELYFGNITCLLHEELKDDPTPYRKDVKTLIQNLLAYCQVFIPETIEISRPNHSQCAKLLVT